MSLLSTTTDITPQKLDLYEQVSVRRFERWPLYMMPIKFTPKRREKKKQFQSNLLFPKLGKTFCIA